MFPLTPAPAFSASCSAVPSGDASTAPAAKAAAEEGREGSYAPHPHLQFKTSLEWRAESQESRLHSLLTLQPSLLLPSGRKMLHHPSLSQPTRPELIESTYFNLRGILPGSCLAVPSHPPVCHGPLLPSPPACSSSLRPSARHDRFSYETVAREGSALVSNSFQNWSSCSVRD